MYIYIYIYKIYRIFQSYMWLIIYIYMQQYLFIYVLAFCSLQLVQRNSGGLGCEKPVLLVPPSTDQHEILSTLDSHVGDLPSSIRKTFDSPTLHRIQKHRRNET